MRHLSPNDYFLKDSHKRTILSHIVGALTNSETVQRLYSDRETHAHTAVMRAFQILKASQLEWRLDPFLKDGVATQTRSIDLDAYAHVLMGALALKPTANIWPQLRQAVAHMSFDDVVGGRNYAFSFEGPDQRPLPDPIIAFPEPPAGYAIHRFVPTATLGYALRVDVEGWKTAGLAREQNALKAELAHAAQLTREIFDHCLKIKDAVEWLSEVKTYQEALAGYQPAKAIEALKPKTADDRPPQAPNFLQTL